MTSALRTRDRFAAGFLLCVLAVGCVALFVGVPIGVLWGLAQITDSFIAHFVLGLLGIPLVIAALAPGLVWVNALYLRVTAPPPDADWEDDEFTDRPGGPLEPMLVVAFVLAILALCAWFFFLAENPVLTA